MNTISEMQTKLDALRQKPAVRILAMESSCDETAAAIIENGRKIVSSVIFSQADTHALYGGVVPEIASRAHVDACDRVVDQALKEAGMALSDVDALAVAFGTAHGAYKRQPHLDFDRLAQIARRTPTPLVMHGGSGLSESDFKRAVAEGVTKINIFTDINCACMKAAAEGQLSGLSSA